MTKGETGYTVKAFLLQSINVAKPISRIHHENFEIINEKIK